MIHIAAATQIRLDTRGRAYHRRKIAAGRHRRRHTFTVALAVARR